MEEDNVIEDEKRFPEWMILKEKLHRLNRIRTFNEGEVWWCSIGENVGTEEGGKGESFLRPVVVFRKLSRTDFLGIPLSSKEHRGTWYANFNFNQKSQSALLVQIRHFSVARLHKKIGTLPENDYNTILYAFYYILPTKK